MKNTILLAFVVLLIAPPVAPPAAGQNREHQQMAADVRMLQEQTQQLAINLAALNQALIDAIKALNARIDQTNEAMRVTLQSLQSVPPPAFDPAAAAAEPAAAADPNAPAPAPTPPAPVAPPPPSTAGLSPTRMFETARADYFAGQYASAINGFEAFLRTFPRSEQADDAQLNIAECHYSQNRWPEAIAAYNLVIQNYPGTNSVPTAYYKRGLAQQQAGLTDAARASWEAVAKTYPDSDEGRLAKQQLSRIGTKP